MTRARFLVVSAVLLGCGARSELDAAQQGGGPVVVDASASTTCRVSAPTLLRSSAGDARSLVVDPTSVYWSADNGVQSVDKSGANARIIASGRKYPTRIAVAGAFVYWGEAYSGLIVRAPVSGEGSVDVLASALSGYTTDVALLGGDIYWSGYGGFDRLAATASTPEILAAGGGPYTAVTTDGHFVYYGARKGTKPSGNIYRFDPETTTTTKLADELQGVPSSLATDGVDVYFNDAFAEAGSQTIIAEVPTGGGAPNVLAQFAVTTAKCPGGGCQGAIATDGRFVYFTSNESDGFVAKVAVQGGPVTIVADHQAQPDGIAVDGACVYWANYADGTIMIAPK